jgi:hypothetical protein
MEQDRPGRDVAAAEEWAGRRVRAEAAWAARSPQGREEIVSVRNAVQKRRTSRANRALERVVLSAEQE